MEKIIIFGIVLVLYLIYYLYFRNYWRVRKTFKMLQRFLDTRDSLVMKLLPGINDKQLTKEIVKLVEERKLNFQSGYNHAILSDVKLNTALKHLYEELAKAPANEMTNQIYPNLKTLESTLKKIRQNYNLEVEAYNQNIAKHKTVCLKLIRMKPLDQYQQKTSISKASNV